MSLPGKIAVREVADGIGCLTGIAPWKRRRITAMLANRHGPPYRSDPTRAVRLARRNGGAVACWATRIPPALPALARENGVPLWRIEDGFIRSVGLGAALVQPCSIVVDRQGTHYDPAAPSDLEEMLATADFTQPQLDRASALLETIRNARITKYNLGGANAPDLPRDRRIVLVIGQVDDDASLKHGGNGMRSADLLERARAEEPDAFIVYRPHPDVSAGLRDGLLDGTADMVDRDTAITSLLDIADAVHVLTSLAGFEALLRGRHVVTHGGPFYAGWGLTEDRMKFPRRGRKLAPEELAHAVLVAYPFYADPVTGKPCEVEQLVEALRSADGQSAKPGYWQRILGRVALAIARRGGSE